MERKVGKLSEKKRKMKKKGYDREEKKFFERKWKERNNPKTLSTEEASCGIFSFAKRCFVLAHLLFYIMEIYSSYSTMFFVCEWGGGVKGTKHLRRFSN